MLEEELRLMFRNNPEAFAKFVKEAEDEKAAKEKEKLLEEEKAAIIKLNETKNKIQSLNKIVKSEQFALIEKFKEVRQMLKSQFRQIMTPIFDAYPKIDSVVLELHNAYDDNNYYWDLREGVTICEIDESEEDSEDEDSEEVNSYYEEYGEYENDEYNKLSDIIHTTFDEISMKNILFAFNFDSNYGETASITFTRDGVEFSHD